MVPDSLIEPFLAAPERAGVLTDFDGTLAPIVDDPARALPLPGVAKVLGRLSRRYALAGVVSGRPVSYLTEHLGVNLWLSGLYGLESWQHGRLITAPEAERWRSVVSDVTERAHQELVDGVEPKGLTLTLHFRTTPDREATVRSWAGARAEETKLVVHPAKASVELRPPQAVDKGTVVEEAAAGLAAVCFVGDDVGDLPAFDALDRLAESGARTLRVGVDTTDAPEEMLERADAVVQGPEGALVVLEQLAADRS